jgi:CheY-like chemotaxis protein
MMLARMATILVVDDDDMMRTLLRRILAKDGHDVVEAADGHEAIAYLRDKPCDLMITDLFMPQQDGLETILTTRRTQKHLPIIAISGGGNAGQYDMLRTASLFGAARVLLKPFRADEVRAAVREVLEAAGPATPPGAPQGPA